MCRGDCASACSEWTTEVIAGKELHGVWGAALASEWRRRESGHRLLLLWLRRRHPSIWIGGGGWGDMLYGEEGDDRIYGANGVDVAYGGDGTEIPYQINFMHRVIDLPPGFDFRYYGDGPFTRLRVSECGWASPDTSEYLELYNWPIPTPHGNHSIIAPFWDNLNPEEVPDPEGAPVGR